MFEEKVFIPKNVNSVFNGYDCHLIDNDSIYSFNTNLTCNNGICDVPMFKIFYNNHYLYQYTSLSMSENDYSNLIGICGFSNYTNFTNDVFYRNDIDSILIIFLILLLIMFLFPYKILSRLFGRWFKW